ncbi:MAG: hypothetical protein HBSAPP03_28300 [Phycisphaerae bacterium]|nr:MAG: hypothetical protein HBSAPP03_28300 [Phycisphaerae bacterium]
MSKIVTVLGVVALAALVGCASNKSSGSAGAVKAKDCCAEKSGCTESKKADGSMGAVGEKKAGCCSGEKKAEGSMGAVAPKADCAKACTGAKTN